MEASELRQLLDRHGPALTLYARQLCGSGAEDIVQEAFLKLVSQPRTPQPTAPWMYRVVRNAALTAARSNLRRRRHEQAAAALQAPWFEPAAGQLLDAEAATRALESLPEDQREIAVAHLWGGLTFEEIAAIVGGSSSTAHRKYRAALETLRERLEAPCPPK